MDYLKELEAYYFPPRPWTNLSLEAIFQNPLELATLSYWIHAAGAENYLEVGVAAGGFMHYAQNVLGLTGYGLDVMTPIMVTPERMFLGDCHSKEAVAWAEERAPYDMVFIDADHSYEAVSLDYKLYKDMASKLIVFHDIAHATLPGPRKLWNEIQEPRKLEIIAPGESLGIGIIFKGGED